MNYEQPNAGVSPWPAHPESAWDAACQAPERRDRLSDRPDAGDADAASIVDWLDDQRSLLPMFGTIAAVVGVILIGGLLLGVVSSSAPGGMSAEAKWTSGICLLVAGIVLWVWELVRRRRRKRRPPRAIPEVRIVLCQLYPTTFNIHDGDGYRETCIAIDAETPDAQADRVFTAFRIWIDRLNANPDAAIQARNEAWVPSGATVFASEEIFGPDARGGYLVRRTNPPADGWAVLVTPRRPAKLVGQLRFADIRQWIPGHGWSL